LYEELYKAWREEKDNPKLQALPKDFYERLHKYFSRLNLELSSKDTDSIQYIFLKKELEVGKKLALNLLDKRLIKILTSFIEDKDVDFNLLTNEEKALYKSLSDLKDVYKKIKAYILSKNTSLSIPKKRILLRFISNTPAIIGIDLRSYGPFKAEDIANLPIENAKVLIKQGIAIEVEVE
jgi:DNA replication factor GINS